ncbi:MAG TPA: FGGY family carbohydrate kinase, partial [Oscillospiraceae bacterium]|nr:FGGY family carbohydrate kinase [Oscillospiraceae bacterium]
DYVAMKLSGKSEPVMHSSDAASLGMFDLDKLSFDEKALEKAEIDPKVLPKVTASFEILGYYKGTVPVCVAIGDNQASFIGSVKNVDESILANVGTGSQMSFLSDKRTLPAGLELRPLVGNTFICVGSALCGGRAFALLENFFRQTLCLIGNTELESTYPPIYDFLDRSSAPSDPLKVSSAFSGTRENPLERGSIENIGTENFTPGNLIWGFLDAIAQELYDMYALSGDKGKKYLIGSGGGLRKNHVLRSLFEEKFSMKIMIPEYEEEAAFGAALSAMVATGLKENLSAAQQIIRYL